MDETTGGVLKSWKKRHFHAIVFNFSPWRIFGHFVVFILRLVVFHVNVVILIVFLSGVQFMNSGTTAILKTENKHDANIASEKARLPVKNQFLPAKLTIIKRSKNSNI
jgi:hypothetical protein